MLKLFDCKIFCRNLLSKLSNVSMTLFKSVYRNSGYVKRSPVPGQDKIVRPYDYSHTIVSQLGAYTHIYSC